MKKQNKLHLRRESIQVLTSELTNVAGGITTIGTTTSIGGHSLWDPCRPPTQELTACGGTGGTWNPWPPP